MFLSIKNINKITDEFFFKYLSSLFFSEFGTALPKEKIINNDDCTLNTSLLKTAILNNSRNTDIDHKYLAANIIDIKKKILKQEFKKISMAEKFEYILYLPILLLLSAIILIAIHTNDIYYFLNCSIAPIGLLLLHFNYIKDDKMGIRQNYLMAAAQSVFYKEYEIVLNETTTPEELIAAGERLCIGGKPQKLYYNSKKS